MRSFAEPAGKVHLLYGGTMIFRMALLLAAQAMHRGIPVAVVDGCNRLDVHFLARYARKHLIDPDQFLTRMFISRGFTCFQMEAAVTSKLPGVLRKIDSNVAMVFGLLDTLYDEQAPLREVVHILERMRASLHHLKSDGVSVLLASTEWRVFPEERNRLFTTLQASVDARYHLIEQEHTSRLFLEPRHQYAIKKE